MLAKVILDFGSARMRATTVAIPYPGPLERFLPESAPGCAFVRRGDGFVALGEAARFESHAAVLLGELLQEDEHGPYFPIGGERVRAPRREDPIS